MMRILSIVLALAFASAAYAATPNVAAANACDPSEQSNPGCCDREPINPDCCVDPTETHYQYDDGTYACLDCDPEPTAPECCGEGETWWEYPNDDGYDCIPLFVVMPMVEYASADVTDAPVAECENEAWATQFAEWMTGEGDARPRCVSQSADAPAGTATAYYDTRYGSYGVVVQPAADTGGPSKASSSSVAVTGYSGIGMDCAYCPPPPFIIQAACLLYYDSTCYSVESAQSAAPLRLLP